MEKNVTARNEHVKAVNVPRSHISKAAPFEGNMKNSILTPPHPFAKMTQMHVASDLAPVYMCNYTNNIAREVSVKVGRVVFHIH